MTELTNDTLVEYKDPETGEMKTSRWEDIPEDVIYEVMKESLISSGSEFSVTEFYKDGKRVGGQIHLDSDKEEK